MVPTVSYFAWLPESLARAFCAESLDTSPTRLYADPVQCLADLEGYEGPRGEKFGVHAALGGLTPLGDTRNSQELSVCQMPKERLPGARAVFFFNRWLQRISRILAVLGYEGIKQATPVVLRPKRKSSAHSL